MEGDLLVVWCCIISIISQSFQISNLNVRISGLGDEKRDGAVLAIGPPTVRAPYPEAGGASNPEKPLVWTHSIF